MLLTSISTLSTRIYTAKYIAVFRMNTGFSVFSCRYVVIFPIGVKKKIHIQKRGNVFLHFYIRDVLRGIPYFFWQKTNFFEKVLDILYNYLYNTIRARQKTQNKEEDKMNAGQKIEIEVTLVEYKAEPIIGRRGVVTEHRREATFKGLDGQTYTQSTTGCDVGLSRVKVGETFTMRATVKEVTETEIKLIRCRKAKG